MTSAIITGIAVLERPRISDAAQPKAVYLDGGLYSGDAEKPLVVNFRYWNDQNIDFSDGPVISFIVASIVKMQPQATVYSSHLDPSDYDAVGDIIQLIRADGLHPAHLPFVFACGQATNIQPTLSTFDSLPMQFVSQLPSREQSTFPMRIEIPDSKRYGSRGKPMPKNGESRFHVQGFLSDITRNADDKVLWFNVRMHNIVYFDRLAIPPVHKPSATPPKMNGKITRKLTYDFSQASPLPDKAKKRPRTDDFASTSLSQETPDDGELEYVDNQRGDGGVRSAEARR